LVRYATKRARKVASSESRGASVMMKAYKDYTMANRTKQMRKEQDQ
jgi:hypothetical protein